MRVKFYAKAGHCVHWPGLKATGQAYAYVGREIVPGSAELGFAAAHPASKEPAEIDAAHPDGRWLIRNCSIHRDLWPADEATAQLCDQPFVALEYSDGEWMPKASAPVKSKSSGKDAA